MIKEFLDSLSILDKAELIKERANELRAKVNLTHNEAFIIANKELESGSLLSK